MSLFGLKVIDAKEMISIEQDAIEKGSSPDAFMETAGRNISEKIKELFPLKKLFLLLGKGNNAGDGLVCALHLLEEGYEITILQLFSEDTFSHLCKKHFEKIKQKNVKIVKWAPGSCLEVEEDALILDAVFGTGFSGKVPSDLASFFDQINSLKNIKIAIDIPSGLDGNSGSVNPTAIKVNYTFFLEFPKSGFFIDQGYDFVGKLIKIEFGLLAIYQKNAKERFFLLNEDAISENMPQIKRSRNKYEAGYVTAIAGSKGMEGAANLSGTAALRSGSGIVKLYIQNLGSLEKCFTDELVKIDLNLDLYNADEKKLSSFVDSLNHSSTVYIGPGIGRKEEIDFFLQSVLEKVQRPLVLDADGLFYLSNHLDTKLKPQAVLTPHKKEMLSLLKKKDLDATSLMEECQKFCEDRDIVLVLKGAVTFIFTKDRSPMLLFRGDPGMAKAGSGDVLTGIIAALLSQNLSSFQAAVLGVFIHGLAGEKAALEKGSFSMLPTDLIEYIPIVMKALNS